MIGEQAMVIASYPDPHRARAVVAALQKVKILATVMASGYEAGVWGVLVFASDADAARAVLKRQQQC